MFTHPSPSGCALAWHHTLLTTVQRAVETYQYWNAWSLNPQTYGQAPHCYASAQHAALHAAQVHRRLGAADLLWLDVLTDKLCALSDVELDAVIARVDAYATPEWTATLQTMSDDEVDQLLASLVMNDQDTVTLAA